MSGKCLYCGEFLPPHITVRRKFCNDAHRVAYNRAKRRKSAKKEAYSIIARVVDRALQEIDFSDESETIQAELRKFRDTYWNN